jgi:hypothetical protein
LCQPLNSILSSTTAVGHKPAGEIFARIVDFSAEISASIICAWRLTESLNGYETCDFRV